MSVESTVAPKLGPVWVPSNFSCSSLVARAGTKTGKLQTLSATQFSTAARLRPQSDQRRTGKETKIRIRQPACRREDESIRDGRNRRSSRSPAVSHLACHVLCASNTVKVCGDGTTRMCRTGGSYSPIMASKAPGIFRTRTAWVSPASVVIIEHEKMAIRRIRSPEDTRTSLRIQSGATTRMKSDIVSATRWRSATEE
jgi:hypothetical protein